MSRVKLAIWCGLPRAVRPYRNIGYILLFGERNFLLTSVFVRNKNNSSMFWFTKSFLATSRLVIVKISIIILSVKESYCKGSWSLDLDRLCLRNNFTVNYNGLWSKTFALMQGERCCVSWLLALIAPSNLRIWNRHCSISRLIGSIFLRCRGYYQKVI